ncbi:MAG: type II toxin-antitoxin system VapC family toxin [Prevotellaceae bacterium]|jgi:PIN domain nuclease of toxin-antitoxin system|nr:type II toxin-antitoxin system VapC family toxin [Prevotellaceae bacterium]
MRYLADTNIFIYSIVDTDRLSDDVLYLIKYNQIYVSSESIKEFIHLFQRKKIKVNIKKAEDILGYIDTLGYTIKYVKKEHLKTLANLPLVENHNDPSDRLIISQAITEKIPLISSDTVFPSYRKHKLELIENN